MIQVLSNMKRLGYLAGAASLFAAIAVPSLLSGQAYALNPNGQITWRSIKVSDSTPDASGVTYNVSFTAATDHTVKGIIVDFCDGSPIIGEPICATPADFTVGGSPSVTLNGGISGGWAAASLNSGRTLKLTDATGNSLTGGSTVVDFDINGVHNPSTTGTFYARIITYTSSSADIASYTAGTVGTSDSEDYGGVALSTASNIKITARVQESLTFSVDTSSLSLGQGSPETLDPSRRDTAVANTQLSTNAAHGVIIRLHTSNACGGLSKDGGGNCEIAPVGSGTDPINAGASALFGMKVADSTGGSGTVSASAPYNTADYSFDDATAGENVVATYGDEIASCTSPVNGVSNAITFAATSTNTTPAGVYTADLSLIATGTF